MTAEELAYLGRAASLVPLYARLRERILAMYPKSKIRVHQTMISFRHPMPYLYVSLPDRRLCKQQPKFCLLVSLLLGEAVEHPRMVQVVEPYPGRYTHHLILSQMEEIDQQLLEWIQQSHDFRNMITGGKARN